MENMSYKDNINSLSNSSEACGCVGYGYVPVQMLDEVFSPEQALANGTLFPELELDICEYGKVCKALGGVS